jgi:exonuclease SbcC
VQLVKLKLKNFLSYKQVILDFSKIQKSVVALVGRNGSGKSSLLDAITFALFGQARGTDKRGAGSEKLLNMSSENKEMSVSLDFLLTNLQYRVFRKKDFSKKSAPLRLTFGIVDPVTTLVKDLSENTSLATQKKIENILNMDYSTFVASSFILQNQIDYFIQLTPKERKEVLFQVLGLEIYEQMQKLVKIDHQILEKKVNGLIIKKENYERLISQESEKQSLIEKVKLNQEQLNQELLEHEKLYKETIIEHEQLKNLQDLHNQLKIELDLKRKELKDILIDIPRWTNAIKDLDKILNQSPEINEKFQFYKNIAQELQKLNQKQLEAISMQSKIKDKEKVIETNKVKLETDEKHLTKQIKENNKLENIIKSLEKEIDIHNENLTKHKERKKAHERREKDLQENDELLNELLGKHNVIIDQIDQMQKIYNILESDVTALCPVCQDPLSSSKRSTLKEKYYQELINIQKGKNSLETEIKSTKQKKDNLYEFYHTKLNKLEDTIQKTQFENQTKSKQIEDKTIQVKQLSDIKENLSQIQKQLKTKDYSQNEQEEVKSINLKLSILKYDPNIHQQKRDQIKLLEPFVKMKADLDTAEQNIENYKQIYDEKQKMVKNLKQTIPEIEQRFQKIQNIPSTIKMVEQRLQSIENQIQELKQQIKNANQEIGGALSVLKSIQEAKIEHKNIQKEFSSLELKINDLKHLEEMFGRNGIPTLILENLLPEIEQEAQRLLGILSNGQMNILFRTQTLLKTSDKIKETLEIDVADVNGTRSLLTFSGGESFRINFSLRIALSKILARRAGIPLQTLIIDEGFGSQDQFARERLIEIVNKLSNEFKTIMVITHFEALQDQFPAQIIVKKSKTKGSLLYIH